MVGKVETKPGSETLLDDCKRISSHFTSFSDPSSPQQIKASKQLHLNFFKQTTNNLKKTAMSTAPTVDVEAVAGWITRKAVRKAIVSSVSGDEDMPPPASASANTSRPGSPDPLERSGVSSLERLG